MVRFEGISERPSPGRAVSEIVAACRGRPRSQGIAISSTYGSMFLEPHRGREQMNKYDQNDFNKNPGKYRQFTTARIAEAVKSIPSLAVGDRVSIRFFDQRINAPRGGVEMPIYEVRNQGAECAHYLFACVLADFRA